MEFRRIDLAREDLSIGNVLFAVKSGDYYKVTGIGSKYTLQQINGYDTKELSKSTINRWYRLTLGYEEQTPPAETTTEQPEENVVEPVAVQPAVEEEAPAEIEPEIQPATPVARPQRRAPNSQPVDPVLQQVRQKIIDTILAECENATSKETNSYTGLKVGKYNFGEVANGKRRFTVRVISKALDEEGLAICNIAPPSYGWTLDATYTVLTEDDLNKAVELLKASYAYRLANTPDR